MQPAETHASRATEAWAQGANAPATIELPPVSTNAWQDAANPLRSGNKSNPCNVSDGIANDLGAVQVLRDEETWPRPPEGTALTIGAYDGVHRGHQAVISQVRRLAGERGLRTAVVTSWTLVARRTPVRSPSGRTAETLLPL